MDRKGESRVIQFKNMKTTIIASIASFIVGLSIGSTCLAQESKPEYTIKEDQPPTGTRIRHNRLEMSEIALNQPYHKLSDRERAKVHSWWEAIPEGDEPPFPIKGLKPIYAGILKAQEVLAVEGKLILIATVDTNGEVVQVKAISSPSQEMTEFAASLVGTTKFKPAVCSGKPCKMDFPLEFDFVIKL